VTEFWSAEDLLLIAVNATGAQPLVRDYVLLESAAALRSQTGTTRESRTVATSGAGKVVIVVAEDVISADVSLQATMSVSFPAGSAAAATRVRVPSVDPPRVNPPATVAR
jgi:hypothetical protein